MRKTLLDTKNCTIMEHTGVTGVTVRDGRVAEISYEDITYNEEGLETKRTPHHDPFPVDTLIIAASPAGLGELVFATAKNDAKNGARSIVSLLPQLANVRRLGSEPLPVLYATFRRTLPHIPKYYVALLNSKYSLTFVQVEELSGPQKTVLAIAASDFDALPVKFAVKRARARALQHKTDWWSEASKRSELTDAARLILTEFQRYVPINLDSDVDWDNTFFQPNLDQQLFTNQVGSQQWCPKVSYPEIRNLYFAGNASDNPISIATVELAVYSGLQAARAAAEQHRGAAGLQSIPMIEPKAYSTSLLLALKFVLAPYAALAKLWVEAETLRKDMIGAGPRRGFLATASAASELGRSAGEAVTDCWKMAESFWREFMR